MKVYYWSPFFTKIATISAVIKSAESLINYKDKSSNIEVALVDAIGEWENYKETINNQVKIVKLNKKNYIDQIPKNTFFKSRISYWFIFFINFFKLTNLVNKEKPDFLIVHLITSLPIFLSIFFNNKTKIILRISGLPKLNIFRYLLWKIFSHKIYRITCPTKSTYNYILSKNIFDNNKIFILRDPVISMKEYAIKKKDKIMDKKFLNKKYLISVGRLTKQKNFRLLILSFSQILKKYPNYNLIILGDGEQKKELENLCIKLNIFKDVKFLGYQENIYKYFNNCDCFILSSLWEDPGFVIIEAALSNLNIIASNCPNGPSEILNNENFLFENNNQEKLLKAFDHFKGMNSKNLFKNKVAVKKNIKIFTKFQHFLALKNILT
jgi:glycosyltransferase involved in cell wall biosynthesis